MNARDAILEPTTTMRTTCSRPLNAHSDIPTVQFPLENHLYGYGPNGVISPTFTRASVAYEQWNGIWYPVASGEPRFQADSTPLGYLAEGSIQNKCTNYNANPDVSLTNVTKSGDAAATLTRVDDSTELANAGLQNICTSGYVFKLDNSGGAGAAYVQPGGTTTNLNAHSVSAYIRSVGGGAIYLGGGIGVVTFESLSSYTLQKSEDLTPAFTTNTITIRADAGDTAYFILNQLEEASTVSSPIVTAGSAVTRAADSASLPLPSGYTTDFGCIFDFTPSANLDDIGATATRLISTSDSRGSNNEMRTFGFTAYSYTVTGGAGTFNIKMTDFLADTTYKIGLSVVQEGGNVRAIICVDGVEKLNTTAVGTLDHSNDALIQPLHWDAQHCFGNMHDLRIEKGFTAADLARLTT